jgi:sterol 24-C-methyltransferase
VFAEILRVLKPGGFFGTYEWLITPEYDDKNPTHREIRNRIEHGNGIPKLVDVKHATRALERVGWEVVSDEDLAITTPANPVPWW